jgi:hypothetical protein
MVQFDLKQDRYFHTLHRGMYTFTLGQIVYEYILSMTCELYDGAGQIGQSPFNSGSNN